MSSIKKSGRPTVNDNKHGKLIIAARKLFVAYDYDKVSIRAIANEIGFNTTEAFSKSFYKTTGIYPSFFMKQLEKQEISKTK